MGTNRKREKEMENHSFLENATSKLTNFLIRCIYQMWFPNINQLN
jgi:hypothetical protein